MDQGWSRVKRSCCPSLIRGKCYGLGCESLRTRECDWNTIRLYGGLPCHEGYLVGVDFALLNPAMNKPTSRRSFLSTLTAVSAAVLSLPLDKAGAVIFGPSQSRGLIFGDFEFDADDFQTGCCLRLSDSGLGALREHGTDRQVVAAAQMNLRRAVEACRAEIIARPSNRLVFPDNAKLLLPFFADREAFTSLNWCYGDFAGVQALSLVWLASYGDASLDVLTAAFNHAPEWMELGDGRIFVFRQA